MVMTKRLYNNRKDALENVKKITRKGRTGCMHITETAFPIQKNDMLGTRVRIKYRKMVPYMHTGETVIYETKNCIVLRFDYDVDRPDAGPHVFIGWIRNTMDIVIGDTRTYNTDVLCVNGRQNEFLLIQTEDFYECDGTEADIGLTGTIVRADQSNSDVVVIAERTDNNVIRFVLADETTALLKNYVPEPLAPRMDKSTFVNAMKDLLNMNVIYKTPE